MERKVKKLNEAEDTELEFPRNKTHKCNCLNLNPYLLSRLYSQPLKMLKEDLKAHIICEDHI